MILGKKVGMTQIFSDEGNLIPVTVVEAGPVTVTQVKTIQSDGYNAVQIGFGDLKENRANKPTKGHFEKWGAPLKKHLAEFRPAEGETYEPGQVVTVSDFVVGSYLDVTGVSKGKGTQGNIKRHGHHRGPMTHGSKHKRLAGALAAGTYPSRVFKGNAGPGRMGREIVTVQNLELVGVVPERNALLIKGATPGRRGGLLKIRYAIKKEAPAPVAAPEGQAGADEVPAGVAG
jgi:large subunit ribosomal protein L3